MVAVTAAHAPPPGAQEGVGTATRAQAAPHAQRRPRVQSDALFGSAHEIEIQHGEAIYRLRITSLGKLILTK